MKGVQNFKSLVFEWLSKYRKLRAKGQIHLVSDEIINERAAVCFHCPHNQSAGGGCGSCRRALRGMRDVILAGRVSDVRLYQCGILKADLQVLVALDEGKIQADNLPSFCWKRA